MEGSKSVPRWIKNSTEDTIALKPWQRENTLFDASQRVSNEEKAPEGTKYSRKVA